MTLITEKLVLGRGCEDQLNLIEQELAVKDQVILGLQSIESTLSAEINLNKQIINAHSENNKELQYRIGVLKRQQIAICVGAGLVVAGGLIIGVK